MVNEKMEELKKRAQMGDVMAVVMLLHEAKRANDETLTEEAQGYAGRLIEALEHDAALLRVAAGLQEAPVAPAPYVTPYNPASEPWSPYLPNWYGTYTDNTVTLSGSTAGSEIALSQNSDFVTLTNAASSILKQG
jgi:hypothetical protein